MGDYDKFSTPISKSVRDDLKFFKPEYLKATTASDLYQYSLVEIAGLTNGKKVVSSTAEEINGATFLKKEYEDGSKSTVGFKDSESKAVSMRYVDKNIRIEHDVPLNADNSCVFSSSDRLDQTTENCNTQERTSVDFCANTKDKITSYSKREECKNDSNETTSEFRISLVRREEDLQPDGTFAKVATTKWIVDGDLSETYSDTDGDEIYDYHSITKGPSSNRITQYDYENDGVIDEVEVKMGNLTKRFKPDAPELKLIQQQ